MAMMLLQGHIGEVFNVGTGKTYSVRLLADSISDNQTYIPKRPGEMETTYVDIHKISKVIGWKPEVDVVEWITK